MTILTRALTLSVLLLTAAPLLAQEAEQPAPPEPKSPAEQVIATYAAMQQYQARVDFEAEFIQGRTTSIQKMDYQIAFDRATERLLIDKPDMRVVVADGQLKMQSDQLPGAHLESAAADPLTWSSLVSEIQMLASPPLVDVIFLIDPDPQGVLAQMGGQLEAGDDATQFYFDSPEGRITLHIDPQTNLIESTVLTVSPSQMPPGAEATLTLRYTQNTQAIEDTAFAFDTNGSTSASTLQDMFAIAQGGGPAAGAGGGGGGGGGHMLSNQPAPPIDSVTSKGDPFKLEDVEADVIVLDFWATWCPPCREGLPHIQAVADWAEAEGKSVAVYTVNVGETEAEANGFWEQQGFTMPIVMDSDGSISNAYGVQGIPQTVVIAQGEVVQVHVGLAPNLEDTLKQEIEAALPDDATEE